MMTVGNVKRLDLSKLIRDSLDCVGIVDNPNRVFNTLGDEIVNRSMVLLPSLNGLAYECVRAVCKEYRACVGVAIVNVVDSVRLANAVCHKLVKVLSCLEINLLVIKIYRGIKVYLRLINMKKGIGISFNHFSCFVAVHYVIRQCSNIFCSLGDRSDRLKGSKNCHNIHCSLFIRSGLPQTVFIKFNFTIFTSALSIINREHTVTYGAVSFRCRKLFLSPKLYNCTARELKMLRRAKQKL